MTKKFSRRDLLVGAGAAGAAGALLTGAGPVPLLAANAQETSGSQQNIDSYLDMLRRTSSTDLLKEHENHTIVMEAGEMVIHFDRRYGSISSITRKNDPLQTNYIGNELNTPGVDPYNSRWTGDLVTTVWRLNAGDWRNFRLGQNDVFRMSGKWQRELTSQSADTRRISAKNGVVNVSYEGNSANAEGIHSFALNMTYRPGDGNSLIWDIEITNTTGRVLEFGELGFPLMVNDDYSELYIESGAETKLSGGGNVDFSKTPLRQKLIHEQKILSHPFIAGHSSYVLLQRPLGDPPYLLVHPTQNTSFECLYKEPDLAFAKHVRGWRGPDILAVASKATQEIQGWESNPWVNGHTSLALQPGEKKQLQLRFAFIPSYESIRETIHDAGNLGLRIVPSMVVQENTDALVELSAKSDVDKIDLLSDNIQVKEKKRLQNKTLLVLAFKGRGQKSLKLHYGDGRWTNLHFYCIEDIETLLTKRGEFVVDRQFYTNPDDPYHRYHCFLPFDHRIGSMFLDSDRVWEVGGSDESGFSEPLFLAQKNVYLPSKKEIDTLEAYVADCLFKYIQNPETYEVRASLYWKDRYPSDGWGDWTKERSEATFRTYNYVHPANIYHALYRIGKSYGLLTRKTSEEYLRMSYRTCLKWFTTGPWRHVGLMEGSNAINILADIQKEGWQQEHSELRRLMKECDDEFVRDPYPYSSELIIDQTAHEQVYFFTRFFGNQAKNKKTVQVLKALRGGNQPIWFRYGNDKRRDVCCWYNASLNGMALLQAYEDNHDQDALIKGYAGVMSVMANVLPDGMGFDQFICTPGIYDHQPRRTFESGTGLWGFLQSAKSYVVSDPVFGQIGFGCRVERDGPTLIAYPKDGLRKRLRFNDASIDLEVMQGHINKATIDASRNLRLEISDGTGLVKRVGIVVRGLSPGRYRIKHGPSTHAIEVRDVLETTVPMSQASHIEIVRA
ncbi:MAG TPA: DUF5695 domain-containing protein [Acidobacteriaceae bacterium]|nr:DUF5695 domain-containing protein [Acidobacteriaceae bacterium]